MSKNAYESAVIINATLDDEQIQSQVSKIKDAITSNNGVINEIEDWGRKRLAYPINKSKIGYYIFYRYEAETTTVAKLERMFNLDEQILRYLTLKLDSAMLEYLEQKKSDAANKVEEVEKTNLPTEKKVDSSDVKKEKDI